MNSLFFDVFPTKEYDNKHNSTLDYNMQNECTILNELTSYERVEQIVK